MSFVGMRQQTALMRRDAGEVSVYGWFFGVSVFGLLSYITKWWWSNLFRPRHHRGGGETLASKMKKKQTEELKSSSSSTNGNISNLAEIDDVDDELTSKQTQTTTTTTTTTQDQSSSVTRDSQSDSKNNNNNNSNKSSDISSTFEEAVRYIRETKMTVSTADQLILYGLYKQAIQGNAPLVSWSLSFQDQSKHHAWSQYRNMTSNAARRLYVERTETLKKALGGSTASTSSNNGTGTGVGVSSMPAVPDSIPMSDMTPEQRWLIAAGDNDVSTMNQLLQNGTIMNVNCTDDGGQTALHMASDSGAIQVIDMLLQVDGINIKAADQYGISVLQAAVIAGHVSVAKTLLQHGADPDQADEDGDTPRHCAADDDNHEMKCLFD